MKSNEKGGQKSCNVLRSIQGFSLVEMIVVMAIFMGIIIISSEAFNRIVSVSVQQTSSSESDVQGVIGLEIMRSDVEHAGYGLPWLLDFDGDFDEVVAAPGFIAPGIDSQQFNSSDPTNTNPDTRKVPRAVQAAASTTDGRDYLVIKSAMAGMNASSKRWAYVEKNAAGTYVIKTWGNSAEDLAVGDQVITLDSRTKRLIALGTSDFSYPITGAGMTPPDGSGSSPPTTNFRPVTDSDFYVVYGVSKNALIAPYNRVDYFVKRPAQISDMPARCAPGTGILYKAVMNSAGALSPQDPLVECVADMQVVFNVAADGQNGVDVNQSGLSLLSAKDIRQQLKAVKIYLVVHEGGKDRNFTYANQQIVVGEGNGRTLDLKNDIVHSDDYKNYRWKTYKLTVLPKNIIY